VGASALFSNQGDGSNTATGSFALFSNTNGSVNAAFGLNALTANMGGGANRAIGPSALQSNTSGDLNTAVGVSALQNNASGSNNIAVGAGAGGGVTTASNVTCLGIAGADVSATTWIANVYGVNTQNGTTAPVIVSADGQLGTVASSERFKKDIATMEKASEAILSLRPVTFHYRTDTKGTPQFGLIAEEVAKVNPALVLPDKEGKPYTVRYDAVNAMLFNEFLKEHGAFIEEQQKVEKLEATVAQQHKDFEAALADLRGQIQKVSVQPELNKPPPQTVKNTD
jgi:Chaperone of endosialidase